MAQEVTPEAQAEYLASCGTSPEAIVKAVRDHAQAHYNDKFGWSEVVEAYSDAEILEETGWAYTPKGAIRKMAGIVNLRSSHFEDIAATAF